MQVILVFITALIVVVPVLDKYSIPAPCKKCMANVYTERDLFSNHL